MKKNWAILHLSEDLTGLVEKTVNKQSKQWNLARQQKSCVQPIGVQLN